MSTFPREDAPMPADEALRLASLRSFDILDSLPEAEFDDFALLAAHICETPFALINLVAEDRQWSKASVGLELGDLPREDAFCATTILEPEGLLLVPDARTDPRFAENPLVVGGAAVRFYAGAAVVSTEGQRIGALCVLDRRTRELRPDQVRALQALARQVSVRLEQRRSATVAAQQVAAGIEAGKAGDPFDDASAGIALSGLDGVLLRVNAALAETLDRPSSDVIGRSYADFVHPDDLGDVGDAFDRLIRGDAASLVVPARLLVGSDSVPVSLTSSAVRGEDGATRLILTVVEDVSAQLALSEEFAAWAGSDAVISTDEAGRIRSWSPAAQRIFGWTRHEILGRPLSVLLPQGSDSQYRDRLRRFVDAGAAPLPDQSVALRVVTKTGEHRDARAHFALARRPAAAGFTVVVRDVSEQLHVSKQLDETRRAMAELMGNVPGMAYRCRNEVGWPMEVVSAGCSELVGWEPQDFVDGRVSWGACIHPDDRERVWAEVQQALHDEHPFRIEYRVRHRDGAARSVIEQGRGVPGQGGEVGAIEGFVFDVTEQVRNEAALERAARYRAVVEAVARSANEAASVEEAIATLTTEVAELTGWPVAHVFEVDSETGTLSSFYWHIPDSEHFALFRAFTDAQPFAEGVGLPGRVLAAGRPEWVQDLSVPLNSPRAEAAAACGLYAGFAFPILVNGNVVAVCEFFAQALLPPDPDLLEVMAQLGTIIGRVFERTRAKESLVRLALYDPLTDLPNRQMLDSVLQRALDATDGMGVRPAVAFIDLDRFKVVNDSLGHLAGDELLVRVAERLRGAIRHDDTAGRVGGDEFMVVLAPGAAIDPAVTRLIQAFAEPFEVAGGAVYCSASIGVVEAEAGATAETVVRDADAAMYVAKAAGGDRYQLFDQGMRVSAVARLEIEQGLRHVLERGELELLYQPTVALPDGRITGAEALVRWRHPERGMVSPVDFIPVAEETGMIVPIGRWILKRASAQAAAWAAAGTPLRVAVNVSLRQLEDDAFLADVRSALDEFELDPSGLVLELTESALARDPEDTLRRLRALAALGVTLAADDFGTGYSSLSYLQRFPLDVLKIDKSFVDGIALESDAYALVRGIVQMARALSLEVVAEGVETADQAALLARIGCDYAQGYHFARPLPAAALDTLLQTDPRPEPSPRLTAALSTAAHSQDLEGVARPLLEALSLLTGMESTFLARFDWASQQHQVVFSRNAGELDIPEGLITALRDTLCYRAVTGTGPLASEAVGTDFGTAPAATTAGLRSYLAVPIPMPDGPTFGVLAGVSEREVTVSPEARGVSELLGRLVAAQLLQDRTMTAERERADRVEAQMRARAQFLAEAEHMLKTPLTILRGWADIFQDWHALDDVTIARGTAALLEHSVRLQAQVDGLLQQARSEIIANDLVMEPITVERFLRAQALAFGVASREHPVVVAATATGAVLADHDALHQVIGHLVDNAIKFAPSGSPIELSARRQGDRIELRVDDAGPGLPEGVEVFRAFERSVEQGGAVAGVGLGLHIVRTLVEAMDGTVTAGGNDHHGTRFVISLPVAAD